MKKIITTLFAASMMLLGTVAFAQPSIGVGFANSTDKWKSGNTTTTNNLSGFYVGGNYNINLAGALNVAPGIYYSLLTKSDADSYAGVADLKVDVTEHYISVPVMFNAGLAFADGIVGRIYAGPTLAYGLASNSKYTASATIPVIGTFVFVIERNSIIQIGNVARFVCCFKCFFIFKSIAELFEGCFAFNCLYLFNSCF